MDPKRETAFWPPLPRRSKLCIPCSGFFSKVSARSAASPFQIEPAALGFAVAFAAIGKIMILMIPFQTGICCNALVSVFPRRWTDRRNDALFWRDNTLAKNQQKISKCEQKIRTGKAGEKSPAHVYSAACVALFCFVKRSAGGFPLCFICGVCYNEKKSAAFGMAAGHGGNSDDYNKTL